MGVESKIVHLRPTYPRWMHGIIMYANIETYPTIIIKNCNRYYTNYPN